MNIHTLEISLVFPHQLFDPNPCLEPGRDVVLVEEHLFFRQYRFHKMKLVFHRASMQFYKKMLISRGYDVKYVETTDQENHVGKLVEVLAEKSVGVIHYCDPVDDWLHLRLRKAAQKSGIMLRCYDSPAFINTDALIRAVLGGKKRYFQTDFYIHERRRLGVLLDAGGRPLGGQWSFDAQNRRPWPKGKQAPEIQWPEQPKEIAESEAWVQHHFSENPGSIAGLFPYPINHSAARDWLSQFINQRLNGFGPYEDAIAGQEFLLHHSMLSPLLNVGLLKPLDVVEQVVEAYHHNKADLASAEGFLRQIIGWREFIRGVYVLSGGKERTRNYFDFQLPMPQAFYNSSTGIWPVDQTITKLNRTAYNHHIERLMVLGNFMLLCEIHPDEVYRWFMEMYIDAYDWVMVPNVYGMSQFADGGLMSTKPYISGSRYVLGMSDYTKGPWSEVWDALFWRFVHLHREKLRSNPRIGMLAGNFERMSVIRQSELMNTAEMFLDKLFHRKNTIEDTQL